MWGAEETGVTARRQAQAAVDAALGLMQRLAQSLPAALDARPGRRCRQVRRLLREYHEAMAELVGEGRRAASRLSDEDMALVEGYAQAQVGDLQLYRV